MSAPFDVWGFKPRAEEINLSNSHRQPLFMGWDEGEGLNSWLLPGLSLSLCPGPPSCHPLWSPTFGKLQNPLSPVSHVWRKETIGWMDTHFYSILLIKVSNNTTETGIKVQSLQHDWCEMEWTALLLKTFRQVSLILQAISRHRLWGVRHPKSLARLLRLPPTCLSLSVLQTSPAKFYVMRFLLWQLFFLPWHLPPLSRDSDVVWESLMVHILFF